MVDKAKAEEQFSGALQEAIDWAVERGLTVDDMKLHLREWINTMENYPEEFERVA